MPHDYVKGICDDLGVCTEEELFYLQGLNWNFDASMEACRNKTLPSINVASSSLKPPTTTESTRVSNQTPEKQCNLENQCVQTLCDVSVDTRTKTNERSQRVSRDEELQERRLPLKGSSSQLQEDVSVDTRMKTEERSQLVSWDGEFNEIMQERSLPLMDQLQDSVETESSSSRNRWSTYVKRCHEMIAFLTAATLAYLPIRYVIDIQRKSESKLQLEDYMRVILRFLGDITMVDPFLFLALAYTLTYIVASASLSRSKVQIAELVSVLLGFGMVFLVIFYISPITFCVCLAFGLFIGTVTCHLKRVLP